jgi:hypothetical protein
MYQELAGEAVSLERLISRFQMPPPGPCSAATCSETGRLRAPRMGSIGCAGQLPQLRLQAFKVDRLGKKLCCAIIRCLPPSLVISVSGYHHDWQAGRPLLDFDEQLQPVHTGHVDVGKDRHQRGLDFSCETIQCLGP